MDKDRERFARLAERAKQPPFTPLENLLVRGKPELWTGGRIRPEYWIECSCGCNADEFVSGGHDQRVIEALAKLRERKGIVVEEKVPPVLPDSPLRQCTLSDWAELIWTTTRGTTRVDFADSITYANTDVGGYF